MTLKERVKIEIDRLSPEAVLRIYDFIGMLNSIPAKKSPPRKKADRPYLKVQKALENCSGSLSEQIIQEREDRF